MKKILVVLGIMGILDGSLCAQGLASYAAQSLYYLSHGANIVSSCIELPEAFKNCCSSENSRSTHASPIIRAFIKERLDEHKLKPRDYSCVISTAQTGIRNNTIILNKQDAAELTLILEKPEETRTLEDNNTLEKHRAIIDHEIGHLKHHDWLLVNIAPFVSSLATYWLSNVLLEKICPTIYAPQTDTGYAKASALLLASAAINAGVNKALSIFFTKCVEYQADSYALEHAKQLKNDQPKKQLPKLNDNPKQRLDGFTQALTDAKQKKVTALTECMKKVHTGTMAQNDIKADCLNNTFYNRWLFASLAKKLEQRYADYHKLSQEDAQNNEVEPFETWVTQPEQAALITSTLNWYYLFDTHPAIDSRIARFTQAAQELEDAQGPAAIEA